MTDAEREHKDGRTEGKIYQISVGRFSVLVPTWGPELSRAYRPTSSQFHVLVVLPWRGMHAQDLFER